MPEPTKNKYEVTLNSVMEIVRESYINSETPEQFRIALSTISRIIIASGLRQEVAEDDASRYI